MNIIKIKITIFSIRKYYLSTYVMTILFSFNGQRKSSLDYKMKNKQIRKPKWI